jgi:nicotinamide-nucleotide amidase
MQTITELVLAIAEALNQRRWKLVTAESCTGGGLAYELTSIPGSSNWFDRGLVTYSNLAKQELLGVRAETLNNFGAVSEQTALEMVEGALKKTKAEASIAITGIAGPDGGTPDKPVGTVWFAWKGQDFKTQAELHALSGDRTAIREQSIRIALEGFLKRLP